AGRGGGRAVPVLRVARHLDRWMGIRQPVLLVLDDLQWADLPSLLLLQHLMQARHATPLLAVAMYRDPGQERGDLSAVLHSLARDVDCRRLTLRGLDAGAVRALLQDAVGRQFGDRESLVAAELE